MKKYKLIKKYPSSPKLGSIIERTGTENGLIYELRLHSDICQVFTKCEIENYPEYWEEVVEKDYEILSFIKEGSDILFKQLNNVKSGDGNPAYSCNKKDTITYCQCLNVKSLKIHSVKRLSDGEIFTVGDKFINHLNTEEIILNIDFSKYYCTNNILTLIFSNGTTLLKSAKKVRQPLFTTEDGVDIFERDVYHIVNSQNLKYCSRQSDGYNSTHPYKTFSTKEAAEEYILMNKPCLSINDVKQELINGCDKYPSKTNGSKTLKLLIELVKSKL